MNAIGAYKSLMERDSPMAVSIAGLLLDHGLSGSYQYVASGIRIEKRPCGKSRI